MRLLLIRHAESQGNFERRLQGHADFPLTALGHGQAKALAGRLAGEGIGTVYSSPLSRAMQTADVVAGTLGVAVETDRRLMEYDLGQISGLTWVEIQDKFPEAAEALRDDQTGGSRYPGDEGRTAFEGRVNEVIDEIVGRHAAGEAAAVVTHGGPIVACLARALGRPMDRSFRVTIGNTSVTTIEVNEPRAYAGWVVASMNDTCHLRGIDVEQPPALDVVAETGEVPV